MPEHGRGGVLVHAPASQQNRVPAGTNRLGPLQLRLQRAQLRPAPDSPKALQLQGAARTPALLLALLEMQSRKDKRRDGTPLRRPQETIACPKSRPALSA